MPKPPAANAGLPEAPDTGNAPSPKRRAPLSRERIIGAALRVMDEEGLEAVSMRRVGRELGVEAMSLYNHVRDKEDILDGITELVLSELEFPSDGGAWETTVLEAAQAWRLMLKAHPAVITLLSERNHPLNSADALRPMEKALDLLRRGGLSEQDAFLAYNSFGGYIFGFVLMETGKMTPGIDRTGMPSTDELRRLIPADQFPRLTEMLPYVVACDWDQQFDFGIGLLVAGLKAKIAG